MSNLLSGQVFGDYVAEEEIGKGGMATVYRARQQSVKRDVALKVIDLNDSLQMDPDFQKRFANEAEFIASLEHIHILPIYSYGIVDDYAYLAMRYLRGGTLRDVVKDNPLTPHQAFNYFEQIAKGLAHAHSKGIVHRDLKPANILLDENKNAYLSDFGLAKLTTSEDELTKTNNVMGTLTYMSPEQLRGEPIDHRADIYAMGIILYQMLTGDVPFKQSGSEDMVSVMYKHLEQVPPAPSQIKTSLPPEIDTVVLRALEKDPDNRFKDMGEMVNALRGALGMSNNTITAFPSAVTPRNFTSTITASMNTNNRTSSYLAVGIIVLIGLIVGAIMLTMTPEEPPLPDFEIAEGESTAWSALEPSSQQVELAQQRLGDDGFVALMACTRGSEYHATLVREIINRARGYGLETRIYDGEGEGPNQRLQLEESFSENVKGYILCPLDYDLIAETIEDITEAGIPIVSTEGDTDSYDGVFTSNNASNFQMGETVGLVAGEYIRDELGGEANVVILNFPDLEIIIERANGLEAGVLANAPDATIVGRYQGAVADFALESVGGFLAEGGEVDVIVSINDAGSYGAIDALVEAGLTPDDVAVFSIDAEAQALEYIEEDYFIKGSLTVGRTETAVGVVDVMTQMLAGSIVPESVTISVGSVVDKDTLPNP